MSPYGSWLNRLESELVTPRCVTLGGTDHRSHTEQHAAISADIRRHTT